MIFAGDISIPFPRTVTFSDMPETLKDKVWFGNLEGSLISNEDADIFGLLSRRIVFNNFAGIEELVKDIHFKAFSLANNHILDATSINVTKSYLDKLGVQYVGAGINLEEAAKEIVIEDMGIGYVIVACGWDLVKCIYAGKNSEGVNPYWPQKLLAQAKRMVKKYPDKRVVIFLHWNYELERYPQPMDRLFAHALIDIGVYAVIGCHAHRVQNIEFYNGKPIVYGLGNFAFRQNMFMDGNLYFPDFSFPEIAFEMTEDSTFIVHFFLYNHQTNVVSYVKSEKIFSSNAAFANLDFKQYGNWFRDNRYQRKALPVFYGNETRSSLAIKRAFVKVRGQCVDILVKNKRLFNYIKSIFEHET